jgi:hypothetical protein
MLARVMIGALIVLGLDRMCLLAALAACLVGLASVVGVRGRFLDRGKFPR